VLLKLCFLHNTEPETQNDYGKLDLQM